MRASLATQKPVFEIPFFSLLTASLSRDLISPFLANYFFLLSFSPPRGHGRTKKTPSHFVGGVSAVTHLLSHLNMTCLNVVWFSYLFCSVQRTGPVVKTGLL